MHDCDCSFVFDRWRTDHKVTGFLKDCFMSIRRVTDITYQQILV